MQAFQQPQRYFHRRGARIRQLGPAILVVGLMIGCAHRAGGSIVAAAGMPAFALAGTAAVTQRGSVEAHLPPSGAGPGEPGAKCSALRLARAASRGAHHGAAPTNVLEVNAPTSVGIWPEGVA